ncbi:MAG: hypothetical protein ACRELY_19710, partial [Polyangiaceae bacterium]
MKNSKLILTGLASLLPLFSMACGGSTGAVDPVTGEPAPSASSSQDDAGAPGTNNNNNNSNNGSSTPDGGTGTTNSDAGSSTTTPVSANCNVTLTSPDLCVDDVH